MTYILDMVAIVNYNFVLVEDLRYLHTGQLACSRTTYVSSILGEHDLCDLHTGHGRDA